jgi:hypothetical protein
MAQNSIAKVRALSNTNKVLPLLAGFKTKNSSISLLDARELKVRPGHLKNAVCGLISLKVTKKRSKTKILPLLYDFYIGCAARKCRKINKN